MKFEKSKELLDRALTVIPNGTQTMSKCYNQWAKGTMPNFIVRAEGAYMWDVDGNKFIDTYGALGPIILGYNNPLVKQAMIDQTELGSIFSLSSPIEIELAETLKEIIPCCDMVRFGKNGSDVTSIAVRVARAYTGKEYLLSPTGHYHGWCDFYAAASALHKGLPESTKILVEHFEYNNLDSLAEKLATGKFAAIIMEPCRLEAPAPGFLSGVRALCDHYNVVLIFDEVVTSFRWSLGGAQQYYGVTPDLATIGKAMSNGMPVSGLVGRKKFMEELIAGGVFFSGTFLGETISMAAALATINILRNNEKEIYSHIWSKGQQYAKEFNEHASAIGLDVEMLGVGPLYNLKFNTSDPAGSKDLYCKTMAENGVFAGSAIYITYAHKDEHMAKMIQASKKSLDVVTNALNNGTLDDELGGNKSAAIFRQVIKKDE